MSKKKLIVVIGAGASQDAISKIQTSFGSCNYEHSTLGFSQFVHGLDIFLKTLK